MSGLLKSTDLKFIPGGEKIGLTRSIYGKANKKFGSKSDQQEGAPGFTKFRSTSTPLGG